MTDSKTPNSPQAERILLACCIREDNKLEEAITIVNDDDFYYENNKIIFSSIKKIYNDNKPVDELSLVEELKSKNLLEEIGGVSYIYSVLESCETNMQSKSSAIIIKER
jgi:replicative DNA helicase